MALSQEQLDEWRAEVKSENMTDVLNAMLAISECEDSDDCHQAAELLEKAGSNVHSLAKQTKLSLPEGRLTIEEFRQRCLAKVKNAPETGGKTEAQGERGERVTKLREALARLRIVGHVCQRAEARLVALMDAIDAVGPAAADNESRRRITAEAFGWPVSDVLRREYASPDGRVQGKFFCRGSDERDALRKDSNFWVEWVLPQMYATRSRDLLHMVGGLPEEDWKVGRP